MDSSVAPTTISGDELEFEGFMFDKGASTPMASLSAASPEDLASLSGDLGPAFDPAQYAGTGTTDADTEEAVSYDDIDPALFESLTGTAQSDTMGTDSKGGLPFWLQFEASPPASGPLAEEDLHTHSLIRQRKPPTRPTMPLPRTLPLSPISLPSSRSTSPSCPPPIPANLSASTRKNCPVRLQT